MISLLCIVLHTAIYVQIQEHPILHAISQSTEVSDRARPTKKCSLGIFGSDRATIFISVGSVRKRVRRLLDVPPSPSNKSSSVAPVLCGERCVETSDATKSLRLVRPEQVARKHLVGYVLNIFRHPVGKYQVPSYSARKADATETGERLNAALPGQVSGCSA